MFYTIINYNFNSGVYYSETVILNFNYVQDTHQLNKMRVALM